MRTKIATARAMMIAALSMVAGAAHAVPIVFDFTGTVTESYDLDFGGINTPHPHMSGQTVIGRITVETDQLLARTDMYPVQRRTTLSETGEAITSELTIGGVTYDAAAFAGATGFVDGMEFHSGPNLGPDIVRVGDASTQYWVAPGEAPLPDGTYLFRELALYWSDADRGLIDLLNGFDPLSLIPVLAATTPIGYYQEVTGHCFAAANDCVTGLGTYTYFSIDSLSISTARVPEPGALALFAMGVLGVALGRRRRQA
ncbi:PEP-CTERM sorting domain-containing protein [Steroidobacter sp. S1-65]|uniref:PEP-CTERM sorting domain-containing protein n=1 Tax=Steroidobacter gossypii TaxID=2805490 RepID=A0ABS1WXH7_9GAMM|nr:PEP-CTERM sorting domain-containing protein [Steroidobacter gossypii]MBM0105684.1 PEP-CTERM sorting domain-containing protein [Steroidobacter gossypii]